MGNDCELRIYKRKILNGTKDMQIQEGLCILVQEEKITDMIVTAKNPLEDLRALRNLEMVVTGGTIIDHPKIKKRKQVEAELDKFL